MTLSQLGSTYNFHDSDIILPLEIHEDAIIVKFELAKHLQYDDFKLNHKEVADDKSYDLTLEIKFINCSNIQAKEWVYVKNKASNQIDLMKKDERLIDVKELDPELFLYTISMSNEEGVHCLFTRESDIGSELQFCCEGAEVLEEKFVAQQK